jgi:hypothetical protein
MNFTKLFRNPRGGEVAGTWFDSEHGQWRVSTVALRSFETEREAVAFYRSNCDPLTGMLSMRHRRRQPAQKRWLHLSLNRNPTKSWRALQSPDCIDRLG